MSTPSQKRKMVALDISQKLEIIEKYNGGTEPNKLASFYNVNPSTISAILALLARLKQSKASTCS